MHLFSNPCQQLQTSSSLNIYDGGNISDAEKDC